MIKAAIWGITGYAGRELARLLLGHPDVQLVMGISRQPAAARLSDLHPSFAPLPAAAAVQLVAADSVAAAPSLAGIDVVFFALPHGTSALPAATALEQGCRVLDLGADFRLKDAVAYQAWYGLEHPTPDLLEEAVYGQPELDRLLAPPAGMIATARLVAVPGCYPTGAILALAPLVANELIELDSIVIDSKSGTSGAGRTPGEALTFSEVHGNVRAYGVGSHRHTPEIEQGLTFLAAGEVAVSFTPHLIPASRGILTTAYGRLKAGTTTEAVADAFAHAYSDAAFVHRAPGNSQPETGWVTGSNHAFYQWIVDSRTNRVVITTAIDNLVKGAAGQAVQCLNIMFGRPETTGLAAGGLAP